MTCPEELVDPTDGTISPRAALQVRVFPTSGLPLDVSVTVNVVEFPGCRVKVDGVIIRIVDAFTMVPDEFPLLVPYWLSPAKDAVTVTVVS